MKDEVISVVFESENKELLDIDEIFKETNRQFVKTLELLGLSLNFDFKSVDNRRIYMNEFIKTFVEFIKTRKRPEKLYMFSNTLTKDDYRNRLIKKLQTVFGFNVFEYCGDLTSFYEKYVSGDCTYVQELEKFLNRDRKCKSMKNIKKYFKKHGYTFLNDVYFNEFANKLCLFI